MVFPTADPLACALVLGGPFLTFHYMSTYGQGRPQAPKRVAVISLVVLVALVLIVVIWSMGQVSPLPTTPITLPGLG